MAAASPHDQTLESLISLYRRSDLSNGEPELEVRFQGVDPNIAETVLRSLVAKDILVDDGTISQTVNAIMGEDPATRPPHSPGRGETKVNLIRQIIFDNGKKTGEQYYRKWLLAPPFRVRSPHALNYNVVLSGEQALDGKFSSDASALIRAKCRASFIHKTPEGGRWRIDLTVTRQLTGSDAQSGLSRVVQEMFRVGEMTPANMFDLLGLTNPDAAKHSGVYQYELEVEHMADEGGKGRDEVRPSEVTALVGRVLRLAKPEYVEAAAYQAEIYHVAGHVVKAPGFLRRFEHDWGLKRLTPQVLSLTGRDYKAFYPPTDYYLLDKADGVRAIASVRDGRLRILAAALLEFFAPGYGPEGQAGDARLAAAGGALRITSSTILDGELVTPENGAPVFHAFDVMAVLGENISGGGYGERISRLAEAVGVLRDFGIDARVKPVVHLTASEPAELKEQFMSPAFVKRPYGTDGRILVEPGLPYRETRTYKWKSLRDTTIDMLARRAPPSILGRRPYVDAPGHELHLLFVGINPGLFDALGLERVPGYRDLFPTHSNYGSYFPIQFSPSDAPMAYLYQHPVEDPVPDRSDGSRDWEGWTRKIDGKVVEMRCAGRDGACSAAGALGIPEWQIVRVREDRAREIKSLQYFGNDFYVAELTWSNYGSPFEESYLWNGPTASYFASAKSTVYQAQTAFTSYVKSRRIQADLFQAGWIIDAAVGKGQDFGRYLRAGVRHLVGIDKDPEALSELIQRKHSLARDKTEAGRGRGRGKGRGGRGRRRPGLGATTLFTLCADLTSPHAEIAAKVRSIVGFPEAGADALVTNLAIHYFAGDIVHIRNFAALARGLVKIGGEVIVTTMFGRRVMDLLASNDVAVGQSWDSRQDGVLKYSIRRDYAENTLTKVGQRIGVLLPFSDGEYYDEFLVNVDSLVAEFTARGFTFVAALTFDGYFEDFRVQNSPMYRSLSQKDFEFLSLYGEIILRRRE